MEDLGKVRIASLEAGPTCSTSLREDASEVSSESLAISSMSPSGWKLEFSSRLDEFSNDGRPSSLLEIYDIKIKCWDKLINL